MKPLWAPWRLEYIQQADELDRCIFCEPEEELVVARTPKALALLNKYPYASGHLLVAPRRHTDDFALADDEAATVHALAARGMDALRSLYAPHGFNVGWNLGRVAGAGVEDHVHLLVRVPATIAPADLVQRVKGASSHMVNHDIHAPFYFKWQGAYGAFSISKRHVPMIREYVLRQAEHHRDRTLYPLLEPPEAAPMSG